MRFFFENKKRCMNAFYFYVLFINEKLLVIRVIYYDKHLTLNHCNQECRSTHQVDHI